MAWLQVDNSLVMHRKTRMLMHMLGLCEVRAVGHLVLLWSSAHRDAPDGDLGSWSDTQIAIACGWDEEPKSLVSALRECGFLDIGVIHNWENHLGSYKDSNRQREYRKRKKSSGSLRNGHVTVTNDRVTVTGKKRREEKRREDLLCPKLVSVEFPCRDSDEMWSPSAELLARLGEVHFRVEIPHEINKAQIWILADPKRKKTKRGYPKFLTSWIGNAKPTKSESLGHRKLVL